jgi:2-aminoethylphosphonate-pyruvate transaminase
MSSFGADPIDFTYLDAVCASGNKCLHGIPGVGFVLVREDLAEAMKNYPRRSYYMSLPMYAGESPPLTPPVPAMMALRQALREYPKEGVGGRHRTYLERADYMRTQLGVLGFEPAIPFGETSCTLTSFTLPAGYTYDRWFEANFAEGFVIYACKGELREKFFQVSAMGELTMDNIEDWIDAVKRILAR